LFSNLQKCHRTQGRLTGNRDGACQVAVPVTGRP
jgi:hypothetical protein